MDMDKSSSVELQRPLKSLPYSIQRNIPTVLQFIRYGINCGFVLATKLALTWLLLNFLLPTVAYAIVHVATFFVSYAIHTKVTFKVDFGWRQLRQYFVTVIGFKILDYFLFGVLLAVLHIDAIVAVLIASIAVLALRFLIVRKVLKRKSAVHSKKGLASHV